MSVGKNVEFIEIEYSRIIERVISGDIDATVMNIDEANDKHVKIHTKSIQQVNKDNTEAVLVVARENEISTLIKELVDVETGAEHPAPGSGRKNNTELLSRFRSSLRF